MGHMTHSIHIDAPVDEVVKYCSEPHNWATFVVGLGEPEKITGDGGVGTEFEVKVLMAGFHSNMTLRLTEDRNDPDGGGHSRYDFAGTSSGWMTWDFKPEDGGTLVAHEMDYTVPGSVVGKVVDHLIYEKRQDRDTRHSLESLKLLMEGSPA